MFILNLPIEPIDGRYSAEWDEWFKDGLSNHSWECGSETIYGERISHKVPPGKFLDPVGTFSWKFSQLQATVNWLSLHAKTVEPPIVVFLHDLWTPGIECFPYMRDIAGIDVHVAGFLHAGAYDPTDLLGLAGCDKWAHGSETSWFSFAEKIFIGTDYHKNKVLKCGQIADPSKFVVTGCPVDTSSAEMVWNKQDIVVWPHRISDDKHPEVFEKLRREECFAGVQFIRTQDEPRSKEEYRKLLGQAKVAISTASHENFGIAMVEAASLGCYPICPKGLSYTATMESEFLYDSYEELVYLVKRNLGKTCPYYYPYTRYYNQTAVTDKIIKSLLSIT